MFDTKVSLFRHWDDVVFENRNQSYGAYVLRRAYSGRLMLGSGISICLFALLLMVADVAIGPKKRIAYPLPDIPMDFESQPFIERNRQPERRKSHTTTAKERKDTQIKVVSTPDLPEEANTDSTATTSPDDGTDFGGNPDAGNGDDGGGGIIPVPQPSGPVAFAEVMPSFPGGMEAMMKFIQRSIRYPNSAKTIGNSGTVYVSFVVDGTGKVTGVSVLRGFHPACDKEAVRVVSLLPPWHGGKQNGDPVDVKMVLPITFDLMR